MRAFAALIPFTCNFYRCLEGLSGKRLGRFQVARTRIRHILNSFFSFYVSSEIQVARMLLASCKVLLASCKVPLASCKVALASYKVPLASCKVPLASCKVGLASCKAHLRMSDQRCPLPYIYGPAAGAAAVSGAVTPCPTAEDALRPEPEQRQQELRPRSQAALAASRAVIQRAAAGSLGPRARSRLTAARTNDRRHRALVRKAHTMDQRRQR